MSASLVLNAFGHMCTFKKTNLLLFFARRQRYFPNLPSGSLTAIVQPQRIDETGWPRAPDTPQVVSRT